MFPCPECGSTTRTRTSRAMNDSKTVRQKYYQCNNVFCGFCFSTLESFQKQTSSSKFRLSGAQSDTRSHC
ncbi:ogr/Delta-like zinc finger family protein [Salmonella enterica]|nr:ogr/Delta-like zinc finger family protein [Salmonella enterica]